MNKPEFLQCLRRARQMVERRISANASHGHIAAGLANEGYDGGYRDALNDVEAMLTHGSPNDKNHLWGDGS
jgi:hypothetical protein